MIVLEMRVGLWNVEVLTKLLTSILTNVVFVICHLYLSKMTQKTNMSYMMVTYDIYVKKNIGVNSIVFYNPTQDPIIVNSIFIFNTGHSISLL